MKLNFYVEVDEDEVNTGWPGGLAEIEDSLHARLDAVPNDAGGETHFELLNIEVYED